MSLGTGPLAAAYPSGQDWEQVGELGLAFGLSALIGLERELRQKPAGLRTLTIVGFASALFMLISKYGFFDVAGPGVSIDPSRIAAQVVSGLGFIGGGLVFVRRDAVRGLTTAAVVWLTAAVGMAAGAGLPLLAVLVTVGHFVIVYGFTPLARRVLDQQVPLEVAPSSNVQTGAYPSLADHPVDRLHRAGFAVTVNTDNRLMSGVSVTSELTDVAGAFGWGWDDVQTVTERALAGAFLDDAERTRLLTEAVRPGYAALRA